jgi:hypothetical protein
MLGVGSKISIHSFRRSNNNGTCFPRTHVHRADAGDYQDINEVRQNRNNIILCDDLRGPERGENIEDFKVSQMQAHEKRTKTPDNFLVTVGVLTSNT